MQRNSHTVGRGRRTTEVVAEPAQAVGVPPLPRDPSVWRRVVYASPGARQTMEDAENEGCNI